MLSHYPFSSEINTKVEDTKLMAFPVEIYWSDDLQGGCVHEFKFSKKDLSGVLML